MDARLTELGLRRCRSVPFTPNAGCPALPYHELASGQRIVVGDAVQFGVGARRVYGSVIGLHGPSAASSWHRFEAQAHVALFQKVYAKDNPRLEPQWQRAVAVAYTNAVVPVPLEDLLAVVTVIPDAMLPTFPLYKGMAGVFVATHVLSLAGELRRIDEEQR